MAEVTPCPRCHARYRTDNAHPGKRLRCTKCGTVFSVPEETVLGAPPRPGPPETIKAPPAPRREGEVGRVANPPHDACVGDTLRATPGRAPLAKPASAEQLLTETQSYKRYTAAQEIARGGMGAIMCVRDADIRREVAMKVMLDDQDQRRRARFVEEAQVTGQLEHPNIVPVHELGRDEEGRPFFTMKLVKGRSLADVLERLRAGDASAGKEYTLGRLLNVLIGVCHAVGFAHSKGVVHRDLKPDNVMLGGFGEVLVMDWGLAKLGVAKPRASALAHIPEAEGSAQGTLGAEDGTPSPRAAADSELEDLVQSFRRESGSDVTQDGTVAGTPAYMPPEQARGDIAQVDHRSDIYSLGAILYEILTLSPPVEGRGALQILRKVVAGEIEAPEACAPQRAIPKELSAIAMKALATEKPDRYQAVEAFRRDIELYLEGRAVSARADTFAEATVKLIKRNKGASIATAVALVALLSGGLWYNARLRQARDRAETELQERLRLEREKEGKLEATRREAQAATERGQQALAAAGQTGAPLEREGALITAQGEFRRALFLSPENEQAQAGLRDSSLRHFALALEQKNWRQAREKLEQAKAADLAEAEYEQRKKELGEAESARERFIKERVEALMADAQAPKRETAHELAVPEMIALKDQAAVESLLPYVAHANANCRQLAIEALAWMGDRRAGQAALPYIQPKCPDGKQNPLAVQIAAIRLICLLTPEDRKAFVAIKDRLNHEGQGPASALHGSVAPLLERCYAQFEGRVQEYVKEREGKKLTAAEWCSAGWGFLSIERYDKAISCYDKAIQQDPQGKEAYHFRAQAKRHAGDTDGAIADYDRVLQLDPKNANVYVNRGDMKKAKGDLAGALADYDKTLQLAPNDYFTLCHRAGTRLAAGDLQGALADADRAVQRDPKCPMGYCERAAVKRAAGDLEAAIADCSKAIELNPRDASALLTRGQVKRARGDTDGAIADCERILAFSPRDLGALVSRGLARAQKGDYDGAIADDTAAIAIDPACIPAYPNRAYAKENKGDWDGALADLNKAIERNPGRADLYLARAQFRERRGDPKAAIEDANKAVELNAKSAQAYYERGSMKARTEDWQDAIADLDKALQLDPKLADAWCNRGWAKYNRKDVDGALADYDRAIELSPRDAAAYLNRGLARSEKGDLDGYIADETKAIELDPASYRAYNNRGYARRLKGDLDGAVADYRACLRVRPEYKAARVNLGVALCALNQEAELKQVLEELQKLDPAKYFRTRKEVMDEGMILRLGLPGSALEGKQVHTAQDYLSRGFHRYLHEKHRDAERDIEEALKLDPALAGRGAFYALRRIALKKDGFRPSLDIEQRWCDAVADDPFPCDSYAWTLLRSWADWYDSKKALTFARKAVELSGGNDPETLGTLASALFDEEQVDAAVETQRKAIAALGPKPPPDTLKEFQDALKRFEKGHTEAALEGKELRTAGEYKSRGMYRKKRKRYDEAAADLEAALKLDPSVGPGGAFEALVAIAEAKKDDRAEISVWRRWAAAQPDDADTQNGYAWTLLTCADEKLRDPKAALPVARKAVELSKHEEAHILDTLALALFQNGVVAEAVQVQEQALARLPQSTTAKSRKKYEDSLTRYKSAPPKP
ncbi:MAG: tetratricopeptide repeat protein [Planctomycetota bacterium]|nr:tetratricopeptide repeat protein [Planctomycetota bacterium]